LQIDIILKKLLNLYLALNDLLYIFKGLETPAQGIRGLKTWGLGWAVASRSADHLRVFRLVETT